MNICMRRDIVENWTKANPVPRDGEICLIQENGEYTKMVIGDGKRAFKDLPKIRLGVDAPCYPTIKSTSIVANKKFNPLAEDSYFIFKKNII